MGLTKEETQKLEKLINWTANKSRNIFITALVILMAIVVVGLGVSAALGGIDWKEFGWIVFIFLALGVWVKSVYDTESNLKFTLKIIKKQKEIIQELTSADTSRY